jgi:sugar phosphate isomerase/epimerase
MKRRNFIKTAIMGSTTAFVLPGKIMGRLSNNDQKIPLGGPVFREHQSPEEWIKYLRQTGYGAAYCPVGPKDSKEEIEAYAEAANNAGIIISEVGAWSNPISPNEEERRKAIDKCIRNLRLADEIGARCCVNISGSRNLEQWAGPHKENLTDETFDLVVETTRKIIDTVKPTRTWFALEAMPWAFPYSPDSYLQLVKAMDRKHFAVHLDPMNMITSPKIYFNNGALIKNSFKKLGEWIKSCHAKDIILKEDTYAPQFKEVRPGQGQMNYQVFLQELCKLKGVPLMMEHLSSAEEYSKAAGYIRKVARDNGIEISGG